MNALLIVVDSLRSPSQYSDESTRPKTPFLDGLSRSWTTFTRAYATECWTLPTHCSMFTGLLPSEHGAHFQSMAYRGSAPTIAEILRNAGYYTEVISRNFMFDGTIPGITRGFATITRPISELGAFNPLSWILSLSKPRSRRLMRTTGFFHPLHRESREFLGLYSRSLMPADELTLAHALRQVRRLKRECQPFFLFCNLYDVHWPYPPRPDSVLRSWTSASEVEENLLVPWLLPKIGSHGYLRPGFRIRERHRRLLADRYKDAVELMDQKLARFFRAAEEDGMFNDTLVVLTSDHGEAFGEHDLYLHDASVFNTHLHVPLWIRHPNLQTEEVDDVVSTKDLFGLLRGVGLGNSAAGTILDSRYRSRNSVAVAEHFYYPRVSNILPRFRQNIATAITKDEKIVLRADGHIGFNALSDPREVHPFEATIDDFARASGIGRSALVLSHLRGWQPRPGVEP